MPCPLAENGVHQLGTKSKCACGFELITPRYLFSVEIYDNDTKQYIAEESFNCSHLETAKEKLEEIARRLP